MIETGALVAFGATFCMVVTAPAILDAITLHPSVPIPTQLCKFNPSLLVIETTSLPRTSPVSLGSFGSSSSYWLSSYMRD